MTVPQAMPDRITIRVLTAAEARTCADALASILMDCVEGGASVNFMAPFTQPEATAFFARVVDWIEAGDRILLAAFDGDLPVGTVQVVVAMPPNQAHRADLAKLLVHRAARGKGVGEALVRAAEREALAAGRSLLMLDTVTGGAAERLYEKLGWVKAAVIPNYARYPDGAWCDTTIFWKSFTLTR